MTPLHTLALAPLGTQNRARANVSSMWLFALAPLAVLGCHREPTYYEDVAPIFANKCVRCHRPGGVSPVPELSTFEEAAAAATKIRTSIQMRDMPPWGAENSGLCGTWHDALWLRDEEMRVLDRWTQNPLPGDRSHARPVVPPAAPPFHASGVVLDTGGDFRPGLGAAAYRCFVTNPADARDRVATAFRITSSEPRSVEQVTLYALDSAEAEATAVALSGEDAELGYTCYGSSRVPGARLLTSWTWDSPVSELPAGVGVRLPGGRKVVVQIHYNPIATGLDVPTHTRIELALDDEARVASYFSVTPSEMALPPRQNHTEARVEVAVPRALRVLGVAPRMHTRGKTMQLDGITSGAPRCMGSFDHWNFYRQRLFLFEKAVDLDAGARLRLSCVYNTLSRNEPTRLGERIDDEECLAELLVVDR